MLIIVNALFISFYCLIIVSLNNKIKTKCTQKHVLKNIYKTETSYRVRVMKNGKKYSKNCEKCKDAISFRNEILNSNV
jgi:hypothetical protein